MVADIEAITAILISKSGYGHIALYLILNLDTLVLRVRDVGAECEQDVAGDVLLNGHLRSGVRSRSCQWVQGELRNAGQFLNL